MPLSAAKGQNSELTPLKPTGNNRPLDIEAIRHFFSPEGAMGRNFEGYAGALAAIERSAIAQERFDAIINCTPVGMASGPDNTTLT